MEKPMFSKWFMPIIASLQAYYNLILCFIFYISHLFNDSSYKVLLISAPLYKVLLISAPLYKPLIL